MICQLCEDETHSDYHLCSLCDEELEDEVRLSWRLYGHSIGWRDGDQKMTDKMKLTEYDKEELVYAL